MQKNKLLLLFPDGVGIRNYLYSKVFADAKDLVLFHNFDSGTVSMIKDFRAIDDIEMPDYRESGKEKFLRELICLSRLHYNAQKTGNPTILSNWKRKHPTFSKQLFYKAIEISALFFRHYTGILKLENAYQAAIRKNPFYRKTKQILEQLGPRQVFCSHQRGIKAAPVFAAAHDLGIPTATVIYSWDNLPKARMALKADLYLVWSEHMKQELQHYYPEITDAQIAVTGTPQFEFYEDASNLIDKEKFYSQYQLDPNKKTICFSGDDQMTSPDDPRYLEDLAQALAESGKDSQYQILLRRSPVDFSGRYDAIAQKYSGLIRTAPPIWYSNKTRGFAVTFPAYDDVRLLVSTAFYADVVVNVGSTMAFDFAMFKKPCVFINYDQQQRNNPKLSMDTIYRYEHFKSMEDKKAVFWLDSKAAIVDTIEAALLQKGNPAMDRWKIRVLGDYKNASANIAKLLQFK